MVNILVYTYDEALSILKGKGFKERVGKYSNKGGLYFTKKLNGSKYCKEELFFKDSNDMIKSINGGVL